MSEHIKYVYAVCDYFATGEGRTISLLITRATPRRDLGDYEVEPSFIDNGGKNWDYNPGVLRVTANEIALRELREHGVDEYFLSGVEFLTYDKFINFYGNHIPEYILKMINPDSVDLGPAHLHFFLTVHYNFS